MRSGDEGANKTPDTTKPKKGNGGGDKAMGEALRSVYQNAVDEHVPDEMLDLLRKLD